MRYHHIILLWTVCLYWQTELNWFITCWVIAHGTWGLLLQKRHIACAWAAIAVCIIGWIASGTPLNWSSLHLCVSIGLLIPAYPQQLRWVSLWWILQATMQQSIMAVVIAATCWILQVDQAKHWRGLLASWALLCVGLIAAFLSPPRESNVPHGVHPPATSTTISQLSETIDGEQPKRSRQLLLELRWPNAAPQPLDGCYIRFYPMHLETASAGWTWQRKRIGGTSLSANNLSPSACTGYLRHYFDQDVLPIPDGSMFCSPAPLISYNDGSIVSSIPMKEYPISAGTDRHRPRIMGGY